MSENTTNNVNEIEASYSIKVTDEGIGDILSTAFEGGISYWCGKVNTVGERLGKYTSEQIGLGGELEFQDAEDEDEVFVMTKEKFLNGIKMFLAEQCKDKLADYIEDGELDLCMIDANDADSIVQYALFDEIRYS